MKKQAFNPYLPSWEYIPDGEPYVFGDRVYIYGSHDYYNGHVFCLGNYVCWSAPVDELGNWRYEGVIYEKTEDPLNREGKMCLYAPDITKGPDGRYYLYYVLDHVSVVSVAVCDTPAGKFEFYGYVHYADGTRLGERDGDEPQFDPGVLTEGEKTFLYTGFCGKGDKSRSGAMATVLGADMLTIKEPPVIVVPGCEYGKNSGFEGHEFFEASSIRKVGDYYYFIYSSVVMHELCYAISREPTKGFTYGGVIVSNCDLHIASYKPSAMPMAYGANNHGSIVRIGKDWYIFYHRHTSGTWYSRQGCAEKIEILPDGTIPQVEITSCGLNGGPLEGKGSYPSYIACNLYGKKGTRFLSMIKHPKKGCPYLTQDGKDRESGPDQYIANMCDSALAGFKYFDLSETKEISVAIKGRAEGTLYVRTSENGEAIAEISISPSKELREFSSDIHVSGNKEALFFVFEGKGSFDFISFTLK